MLISNRHADYSELTRAIETAAAAENFAVVICQLEAFSQQIRILQGNHVDGIILVGDPKQYRAAMEDIQLKQIPCVVVADAPHQKYGFPTVYCRADEAAYAAVSYLIDKGHRKIGCLALPDSFMAEGYRRALYENNIEFSQSDIFQRDITDGKHSPFWMSGSNTAIQRFFAKGQDRSFIYTAG